VSRPTQSVLWGLGALLAGGLIAAIVALFSFSSHGGSAVAPTQVQPRPAASAPPRGAVVLAQEAGTRAVALAVRPEALTATVLAPSGGPESGLKVAFRVGGSSLAAHSCGPGCYQAAIETRPSRVAVVLPSGTASFRIPSSTTPGSSIVARAARAIRGLRSLVYVESLRSGATGGIVTTWSMTKPDTLSYQIHGGAAAVVIGKRRWDQAKPGAKWAESQSPVLNLPAPAWGGGVTNARVLGSATVKGHAVWIVSFATPSVPAWFTAWIEKRSYRPRQLRMTAPGHFMFHRYTEFNAPLRIKPPT
jgi:hypothetical protein